MDLIYKNKDHDCWSVRWVWLPYFIASDVKLIRHVDRSLSERFGKEEVSDELVDTMTQAVLDLVSDWYSIPGLRSYISAMLKVEN